MKVQMIVFAVVTANTIILVQASTTSLWLDRSDVQKLAISVVNSCPLGTNGHLFLFLQVGTQQYCGILSFSFTKYCARTTNADLLPHQLCLFTFCYVYFYSQLDTVPLSFGTRRFPIVADRDYIGYIISGCRVQTIADSLPLSLIYCQ